MAGIFISYRRADSDGWAGRLRDALRVRFGDIVFQDVDNIADGEIFSDVIDRALQACDVALVIIGPTWASARDEQDRRRLDLEDDWVRTETAMVLNRRIRVIPVLVGGSRLPRADELPEELRSLTKRQAREIRSTSWDSDVAQLASHLEQIVGRPRRKVWLYAAPAIVAAAALGAFLGIRLFDPSDTAPSPPGELALAPTPPLAQPADSPPAVTQPQKAEKPQKADKHESEPGASAEKGRGPTPPSAEKGRASAAAPEKPERAVASAPVKSPPGRKDSSASGDAVAKPQDSVAARADARARPAPDVRSAEAPPRRAAKEASADAQPPTAKPPPVAPKAAAAPVEPGRRVEPVAPTLVSPDAPSASPSEVASAPVTHPPVPSAPRPSVEVAKAPETATEAPAAARSRAPAAAGTGVTGETVARIVPISLPNRPPSARELKIGDAWTYRLRDLAYSRDPVTATHEVRGGDTSGIREVIRIGERRSDGDDGGTQRRLPLEARMFEQQIEQNAILFEFAPFLTAFSDVRPGLAWNDIAVGGSDGWRISGKVTGREHVRTAAGSFDAIKAELQGRRDITFPTTRDVYYETNASRMTYVIWYVPEIGRAVKYDRRTFNRASRLLEHEQYELVSYQLK
jgi:hypothetical protein